MAFRLGIRLKETQLLRIIPKFWLVFLVRSAFPTNPGNPVIAPALWSRTYYTTTGCPFHPAYDYVSEGVPLPYHAYSVSAGSILPLRLLVSRVPLSTYPIQPTIRAILSSKCPALPSYPCLSLTCLDLPPPLPSIPIIITPNPLSSIYIILHIIQSCIHIYLQMYMRI